MVNVLNTIRFASAFFQTAIDVFSAAEVSYLCSHSGVNYSLRTAANQHLRFGSPGWNNMALWHTLGGMFPSYAKGLIHVPADYRTDHRWSFAKKDGYVLADLDTLSSLGAGDVLLHKGKPSFGMKLNDWDVFLESLANNGVRVVTFNRMMADKISESSMDAELFEKYISLLQPKQHFHGGKTWKAIKVDRYNSIYFRVDGEEMEFLEGVTTYTLRHPFSLNGMVVKDRHLVMALVINYLITARNYTVLKGRRAYLSNVFVDDTNVGVTHPLLDLNKKWKNGNLAVSASAQGYVPLLTKGTANMNLTAAGQYHEMGIATFLHKSAKWLLVGPGANSVGVFLQNGDVNYMTNVDKATKLMGRYLHGVPTAVTDELKNSSIGILIDGERHTWKGHPFKVCRVQSPIIEEGSGNGMGHPGIRPVRKFQTRVITDDIPGGVFGKDSLDQALVLPRPGEEIKAGDSVIKLRHMQLKVVAGVNTLVPSDKLFVKRKFNDGVMDAVVQSVETSWNQESSLLHVRVVLLQYSDSDAQKYRGTGKYRIHDYCRNVKIVHKGKAIFNPSQPMDEVNCVEHLVGDEEGKTMTQVVEMAAAELGATWLGTEWDKEKEIQEWVENNRMEVTVSRWGIEPHVYALLKEKFGSDPDFEFVDESTKITHRKANAWMGTVVEIIEVPLTETFLGDTTLFGEVVGYMAIQYPKLYSLLMEETMKNHLMAKKIYEMAMETDPANTMSDPFILVDAMHGTKVVFGGDKVDLTIEAMSATETEVVAGVSADEYEQLMAAGVVLFKVSEIKLPVGELDLATMRGIHKCLDKYNRQFKTAGMNFQFSGFNLWASNGSKIKNLHIYPAALARASGTVNHNIAQGFLRILFLLGTEQGMVNAQVEQMRQNGGWESVGYRLVSMLQGAVESMALESNSLMAKAARTGRVGFTARVATTIDKRCAIDECRLNPETAKLLGHRTGDICLPGRNPMPKMGALRLVLDERVPKSVFMLNAFTWHAFNEGDADGDSVFWITITPEGDVVEPTFNGKRVTLKGSLGIYEEVTKLLGPTSAVGYWQARGVMQPSMDPKVLLKAPYHDFHENNSREGAKKNLKGGALKMKPKAAIEMEGFYEGTVLTQRVTIATGFFLYSASEMAMHRVIAKYSRELGIPAVYGEILKVALSSGLDDVALDLIARNMSMEICARMFYEGAGSLGGYKESVWLLWGRLRGIGCPTNQDLLSDQHASQCSRDYREASDAMKLHLFRGWFVQAYGDEFSNADAGADLFLDRVVNLLWEYYESYTIYLQYERGRVDGSFIYDETLSLERKEFIMGALLAGMYRRINKGITEGGSLDYGEAQHLTWAINYTEDEETFPILEVVYSWFTSGEGQLTPFGMWFLSCIDVSNTRISLIKEINSRSGEFASDAAITEYLRNGMKVMATKRRVVDR